MDHLDVDQYAILVKSTSKMCDLSEHFAIATN